MMIPYKSYKVEMSHDGLIHPIFLWLVANVGKRFDAWNWRCLPPRIDNNIRIYFYDEEDKVKFILRWL